jgi:hypothetical protein
MSILMHNPRGVNRISKLAISFPIKRRALAIRETELNFVPLLEPSVAVNCIIRCNAKAKQKQCRARKRVQFYYIESVADFIMLIELGMNYFTVGRLRFDPNSHLRFNLSPRAICADAMSKETQRGKEPLRVQQVHIERQKGAAKFTNGCRSEIFRQIFSVL